MGGVKKIMIFADVLYCLCWRRVGELIRKSKKMCLCNIGMVPKSQIISEAIFSCHQSFQKTNAMFEIFCPSYHLGQKFFIRFFRRIEIKIMSFWNYLTFDRTLRAYCPDIYTVTKRLRLHILHIVLWSRLLGTKLVFGDTWLVSNCFFFPVPNNTYDKNE